MENFHKILNQIVVVIILILQVPGNLRQKSNNNTPLTETINQFIMTAPNAHLIRYRILIKY